MHDLAAFGLAIFRGKPSHNRSLYIQNSLKKLTAPLFPHSTGEKLVRCI